MGLITALGFLTTLPVPRRELPSSAFARALPMFPIVGLIVGALLLALDLVLSPLAPSGVRAALLIVAGLALTRALHLDGLMDCCDGLFGGFTPERRLAIMRDSHVGAFGVLGGVADLLLRYSALVALDGHWRALGLLLPPLAGRWALVLAIVAYPYGRETGLGAAFAGARRRHLALGTLAAAILAAACWWPWGALALPLAAVVAVATARFMLGRLPGLTGDCYGAINELVEGIIVLVIVALQTAGRG